MSTPPAEPESTAHTETDARAGGAATQSIQGAPSPTRMSLSALMIFSTGLLFLFFVLAKRRLDDFDLPWHIATGQRILATHGLPRVDDLSFTGGVVRYVEPISDVAYALILRHAGIFGLQISGAIVACFTLAVLTWRARYRGPIGWFVIALTAGAAYPFLYVRPAETSLLFLAIALACIEAHRRAPMSKPAQRALLVLVPLQLVWANTHGFAPFGAYFAVAYAGYRGLARVLDGRFEAWLPRQDGRDAPRAIAVAVFAIAATTISRGGPRLLLGRDRFDEDLADITDWTPTTFDILRATSPVMFALIALVLVALLFGRDPVTGRRAPSLWEVGVTAVALLLTAQAIRFVCVSAVLIAPIIIDRLALSVRPSRIVSLAAASSMSIAAIFVGISLESELGVGWLPSSFPDGAVAFIERAHPAGNMWNFMPYGGYLELRLYPGYRAFTDGRNSLVRDRSIVTRARLSMADDSVFDGLVHDYSMEWAVTCSMPGQTFNAPLASKTGWRMVFLDDVATIYVREEGPNAALANDGYRVLRHLIEPNAIYKLVTDSSGSDPELLRNIAHDGALAAQQAPTSIRSLHFAAIGAFAVRDRAAFDRVAAQLEPLSPGDGGIVELRAHWDDPQRR